MVNHKNTNTKLSQTLLTLQDRIALQDTVLEARLLGGTPEQANIRMYGQQNQDQSYKDLVVAGLLGFQTIDCIPQIKEVAYDMGLDVQVTEVYQSTQQKQKLRLDLVRGFSQLSVSFVFTESKYEVTNYKKTRESEKSPCGI